MLSDIQILTERGPSTFQIEPFDESRVQPSSYDVTLGNEFLLRTKGKILNPYEEQAHVRSKPSFGRPVPLPPKTYILGVTVERVTLGPGYVAELAGKSSLGRLGIVPHIEAGFIDPGFSGPITLEIFNYNDDPVLLWPGMPIGSLKFTKLDRPAQKVYAGRYADAGMSTGPQSSRYFTNERPS